MIATFLAGAAALVGPVALAPAAVATPVYQIAGQWAAGTPAQLRPGQVVTSEWRMNLNDDAEAPSNAPVDNVTFTATATNGRISSLPSVCRTDGVSPSSQISADGTTLTCNLGTRNMGTAVAVQVPVVVTGESGDQLSMAGEIGGQTAQLEPIPIVGRFGVDITWSSPSGWTDWPDDSNVDMDFQWTVNLLKGSEAGPDSVSYTLTLDPSVAGVVSALGCGPFTMTSPSGHPWSGGPHPSDQLAPFVGSCTLTATGTPNQFTMTLSGIDYSLTQVPSRDSGGNALPVDRSAVASGRVLFRLGTTTGGSLRLTSSAPTYSSADGSFTSDDDAANNTASKTFTRPGVWASAFYRSFSGQGGTNWDDTYRASPGTELQVGNHSEIFRHAAYAGQQIQQCTVLDVPYVTLARAPSFADPYTGGAWARWEVGEDPAITTYYYVGNDARLASGPGYDPQSFAADCNADAGSWTTTLPADLGTVKAVRSVYNADDVQQHGAVIMLTNETIRDDVRTGQDIWQFSSYRIGADAWTYNQSPAAAITPTPNARYDYTTGWRDLVRVVSVAPYVEKSVDRSSVEPGVPAVYTIRYAANGGAGVPATVDDYVLTDTLPVGMRYVAASASPEPQVGTDTSGRQVLTWTFDGVPTNQLHALTYQAVANEQAEPGQTLTNSVVGSVAGLSSVPATASVVLTQSGSTTIGKTADQAFIPNVNGDGVGDGSWTVTLRSADPVAQSYTDTIDILPYDGDGRGTSFSGTYELTGVTAGDGATVYYTDADPASLSDDPADPSNGSAGDPSGNTVGWTSSFMADATAVRVVGPRLDPGATQTFTVAVRTDGARGGDVLVNRAQARAEHTELVMRTSAPVSVASYYSASLKKYVQDRNGDWRDANDAADYPTFRYGDAVRYRIVVTNTGQGTLTNVEVADDRQPQLGDFHIDSLAPGESQAHEYSLVLDRSTTGTVVNTASATADTPPDSGVPPTIPPDQAGFEVANYTTVKTSDPADGTSLRPGDTVTYTVTVTQQGSAPADAELSDDLSKVLDDATYNGDVTASTGTATYDAGFVVWSGTLPVGGTATLRYSVTVKDLPALQQGGSFRLDNAVTSPGCPPGHPAGRTSTRALPGESCSTVHPVGAYEYSKTSDPRSGSRVAEGDTVTYTLRVQQVGKGAVEDATVVDDLTRVLDDARYDGDARASQGTVKVDGSALSWAGDLAVGDRVTIAYSVEVGRAGDERLVNVVTGGPGSRCVDAPDGNAGCRTEHEKADVAGAVGAVGGSGTGLPDTGSAISPLLAGLAGLLVLLGVLITGTAYRRRSTGGVIET